MQPDAPATTPIPLQPMPQDEHAQRACLHHLIDTLPAVMLAPTLTLLLAGPRYLLGMTRLTPPRTR